MPEHKVGNLFGWEPASNIIAKPFVKWAGGKSSLLPQLESLLPSNFDSLKEVTYIESIVVSISERFVWIFAMLSDNVLLASVRSCFT